MGERPKIREAEKSNLTLSFNSKEENLLKRQLLSLGAMQSQSALSWTLEQQVLYNRFQLRLRRSELAHARLLGDRELARRLVTSAYLGRVNAESKQVVGRLLHAGQVSRAVSAPVRTQRPRESCEKQTLRAESGEGVCEVQGTAMHRPGYRHRAQSTKGVRFDNSEPRPKSTQRPQGLPPARDLWLRPHTVAGTGNRKRKGSARTRRSASALPLSGQGVITPQQHLHTTELGSRSRTPMSTSRMLFLNLGGAEAQKLSLAQTHATLTQEAAFDSRVKQFADSVKSLQPEHQGSQQRDYYCERLQRVAARRRGSLPGDDREQQRWLLLGREADHRSTTIRKLDTDFKRQSIPQDILLMEAYNTLLTEENRAVRNWPENDPYRSSTVAEIGAQ